MIFFINKIVQITFEGLQRKIIKVKNKNLIIIRSFVLKSKFFLIIIHFIKY